MKHILLYYLALQFLYCSLCAQPVFHSLPHITHYTPDLYNKGAIIRSGAEIRAIAQFQNHVYFATEHGLLIFDGNRWNRLLAADPLHSVEIDTLNQKIFVGGESNFGYFKINSSLQEEFVSLLDILPDSVKSFSKIFDISVTPFGTFFIAAEDIFIYDNNAVESIFNTQKTTQSRSPNKIQFTQFIGDSLFINCINNGPSKYSLDTLIPYLPELTLCFNRSGMNQMLYYNSDSVLVATEKKGLIVMAKHPADCPFEVDPPPTALDTFLKEYQITSSLYLKKGLYAVGTKFKGVFIFNKKKEILYHLSKENGLGGNTVLSLHQDHLNNLWVGLNNVIDYVELNSPFQRMEQKIDLPEKINAFHRQFGRYYIASSNGVYYQEPDTLNNVIIFSTFCLVPGTEGENVAMHRFDNKHILVSHKNSIYFLDKNHNFTPTRINLIHTFFEDIPGTPYFVGNSASGLIRYDRNAIGTTRKISKKIERFNQNCKSIIVENQHNIWVTTLKDKLFKLNLYPTLDTVKQVIPYSGRNGLPEGKVYLFKLQEGDSSEDLVFSTPSGTYNYNSSTDSFQLAKFESKKFISGGDQLRNLVPLPYSINEYLYLTDKEFGCVKLSPLRLPAKQQYNKPVAYIKSMKDPFLILPEKKPLCLLGTKKDLWLFNPNSLLFGSLVQHFKIYVRKIKNEGSTQYYFSSDFFQDSYNIHYEYRFCKRGNCQPVWKTAQNFQTEWISRSARWRTLEIRASNTFGVEATKTISIPRNFNWGRLILIIILAGSLLFFAIYWYQDREINKALRIKLKRLELKISEKVSILKKINEAIETNRLYFKKKNIKEEHPVFQILNKFEQILDASSSMDIEFTLDFINKFTEITQNEAKVAFYTIQGLTTKQIAVKLDTSIQGIYNARSNMINKLSPHFNKGEKLDDFLKRFDESRRK